jgi:uncharacterized protein (DUF2062 family)
MLFGRRIAASFAERLRVAVWPRRSWGRSLRYVGLRLVRLRSTPHRIALGAAAGVFVAFTPLLGLQMVLAGALALVLRASVPAAMLGTFVGNPLSWPLIWTGAYAAGSLMLGLERTLYPSELEQHINNLGDAVRAGSAARIDAAAAHLEPVFLSLLTGGAVLGLLTGIVFYYTLRGAVAASQSRRRALP